MKRSSLQVMTDTVHALMMRELKTRFGSSKLGYFWAIAEPAAQASVLAILFSLIGRSSLSGVPVALFMLVALVPFKAFAKLLPQLANSVTSNKALFGYRQVSPIDPFITRMLIELATFVVVYLILMTIMAWLGYEVWPQDLLKLLMASALLMALGIGIGLVLVSAVSYWEDTTKVLTMVMTPMFFISGIFYTATMIPSQYWYLFTWNPVFHVIELSRDAMFVSYTTPVGSFSYVAFLTLVFVSIGLMLYWTNRRRFVAS